MGKQNRGNNGPERQGYNSRYDNDDAGSDRSRGGYSGYDSNSGYNASSEYDDDFGGRSYGQGYSNRQDMESGRGSGPGRGYDRQSSQWDQDYGFGNRSSNEYGSRGGSRGFDESSYGRATGMSGEGGWDSDRDRSRGGSYESGRGGYGGYGDEGSRSENGWDRGYQQGRQWSGEGRLDRGQNERGFGDRGQSGFGQQGGMGYGRQSGMGYRQEGGRDESRDRSGMGYGDEGRREYGNGSYNRDFRSQDDFRGRGGWAGGRDDRFSSFGRSEREQQYERPQGREFGQHGREFGHQGREFGEGRSRGSMNSQGWNQSRGSDSYSSGRDRSRSGAGTSEDDRGRQHSWQQSGPHAGRGPKGWRRTDDRISEDICEALTRHPAIDASDIDVKVTKAEVTLSGTVDSREAKRAVEEVAERVFGVTEVSNQLRVRRDAMNPGSDDSGRSSKARSEVTTTIGSHGSNGQYGNGERKGRDDDTSTSMGNSMKASQGSAASDRENAGSSDPSEGHARNEGTNARH